MFHLLELIERFDQGTNETSPQLSEILGYGLHRHPGEVSRSEIHSFCAASEITIMLHLLYFVTHLYLFTWRDKMLNTRHISGFKDRLQAHWFQILNLRDCIKWATLVGIIVILGHLLGKLQVLHTRNEREHHESVETKQMLSTGAGLLLLVT